MTTGVTVSLFADDEGLEASPEHLVNMATQPLAARMRPQQLADFIGQEHLLAPASRWARQSGEGCRTP